MSSRISSETFPAKTFKVASSASFFLCFSINATSVDVMMPASSCMASFLSRCLSILAFLLDLAKYCLVALAMAATSFLLKGGEVGLGDDCEVCDGRGPRRVKVEGLGC